MNNRALLYSCMLVLFWGCAEPEFIRADVVGRMELVPFDRVCGTSDFENAPKLGTLFASQDYPSDDSSHTMSLSARCALYEVDDDELVFTPRMTFGFFRDDYQPLQNLGPTNSWFEVAAGVSLFNFTDVIEGCETAASRGPFTEMYIAGTLPDFDYIDVRARGTCVSTDLRIWGTQ